MRYPPVLLSAVAAVGLMLVGCDADWWTPECGDPGILEVTSHFVGFDDYVGHEVFLRVTGSSTWNPPEPGLYEEVFRTGVVIPAGEFSLHGSGSATTCFSVHVDFFVDVNDNGVYDVPPTDHAWRLHSHVWEEDDMHKELTFTFTLDPSSCTYDDGGAPSSCAYRDIEWPA